MTSPSDDATAKPVEHYWWINAIGLALSLLIAWLSFEAYATEGVVEKAWVCVICQALAVALAILARRAATADMPAAGVVAGLGALGCAWWASHGLALAWASGGDPASDWMVLFLTAMEPAVFLLAEHVREGRALRAAAVSELAQPAGDATNSCVTPLRRRAGGAALAVTALSAAALGLPSNAAHGAAGASTDASAVTQVEGAATRAGVRQAAFHPAAPRRADKETQERRKEAARVLLRQRAGSNRSIAARVGLPPRTVDRLAHAMAQQGS